MTFLGGGTCVVSCRLCEAFAASDSLKDIRFINVKTEHPHLDKVRGGAIFIGTTDEVLEFLKEPKKYSALVKNMVIEDSERLS